MKSSTQNRIFTIRSKVQDLIDHIEEHEVGEIDYILAELDDILTKLSELSRTALR